MDEYAVMVDSRHPFNNQLKIFLLWKLKIIGNAGVPKN